MEPGAVVYAPSTQEVMAGKLFRLVLGALLILVGVLAMATSLMGGLSSEDATGGTAMTLMAMTIVGVIITLFGLKYIIFGLRWRGVTLYERAVAAEFPSRLFIWPERRVEPLLRVRVGGSARLTNAFAITTRGYEFRLPDKLIESADLWYLGSLGVRPVAPGGRAAKAAYDEGTQVAPAESDLVLELEASAAPDVEPEAPRAPAATRAPRLFRRPAATPPARPPASDRPVPTPPPAMPRPPPTVSPEPPPTEAPAPLPVSEAGEWDLEEIPTPGEAEEAPPAPPEAPQPEPEEPEEKPKKPEPGGWDWEEVNVPPS